MNLEAFLSRCAAGAVSSPPKRLLQFYRIEADAAHVHQQMCEQRQTYRRQLTNHEPGVFVARLKSLRQWMKARGLDAILMTRTDVWLSENPPMRWEHVVWLSGFSGSFAEVIVTHEHACVISDGRYEEQLEQEIDTTLYQPVMNHRQTAEDWLIATLGLQEDTNTPPTIGINALSCSYQRYLRIKEKLKAAHIKPLHEDPFDFIWEHRPPFPLSLISKHPNDYNGEASEKKIARVHGIMDENKVTACLISASETLAWLLNLRAEDLAYTPLWLAGAILYHDHLKIFAFHHSFDFDALTKDAGIKCQACPWQQCAATIAHDIGQGHRMMFYAARTPFGLLAQIKDDAQLVDKGILVEQLRAQRNRVEIQGARNAHLRDGARISQLLAWIDAHPSGQLSENDVAEKISALRQQDRLYQGESFPAIAAMGAHGALPHYRCTPKSNTILSDGGIFLLDCGGQYTDGTTDITRTIVIGDQPPSRNAITSYTAVLKAMIALSLARVPKGTHGSALDLIARSALWSFGFNFAHGVGHGVGSFSCVHEGPYNLSPRSHETFPAHIIFSNEPGHYVSGSHGVRIENLLLSTPCPPLSDSTKIHDTQCNFNLELLKNPSSEQSGESSWIGFQTLTAAPLEPKLIDKDLLFPHEMTWINTYHALVAQRTCGLMEHEYERNWLNKMTRPI